MEIDEQAFKIEIDIIRNIRNKLLLDSDIYLINDYPITHDNLILIKEYRQQLRDYMNTFKEEFIKNGKHPEMPIKPNLK